MPVFDEEEFYNSEAESPLEPTQPYWEHEENEVANEFSLGDALDIDDSQQQYLEHSSVGFVPLPLDITDHDEHPIVSPNPLQFRSNSLSLSIAPSEIPFKYAKNKLY